MLKPYVCVACEKVILAADGVASLISLFNKMIITTPAGAVLPKNAVAPNQWAVFSIFDCEPGDELKEYIYCLKILYPDQSQFGEIARIKLIIERNKSRTQVNAQVPGFPIGQIGMYTISSWVEENQKIVVGPIDFKIELEIHQQKTK